jgi:hypothetical protein
MKQAFNFIRNSNKSPPQQKRHFNFINNSSSAIAQNPSFQFAQRHAISIYPSNSIYSFIPKNGCTTLRASLATANGFITDIKKQINWLHNNSYTFSGSLKELTCADYTFTVLRCPYGRLVSLFLDKFVDKTPIAWTFYRSSNNKFEPDDISFSDFINYLNQYPAVLSAEIHWRKQSDFLLYEEYDDYFDFSDFKHIKKILKKKINLELIDTRNITNHGQEKYQIINDINHSETSVIKLKQLKEQGSLPSLKSMYSEALREKVQKIYQKDFSIRKKVFS